MAEWNKFKDTNLDIEELCREIRDDSWDNNTKIKAQKAESIN